MMYRLIIRPEAETELAEAFDWYERRLPGLGAQFLTAADTAVALRLDPKSPDALQAQGGVYLLIRVKEYPRFEALTVKGSDDVSEDDIKKKISLTKGQILTPQDTSKAIASVKALYEEEGHLLADVKSKLVAEDTGKSNRVTLQLFIDGGTAQNMRIGIGQIQVMRIDALADRMAVLRGLGQARTLGR